MELIVDSGSTKAKWIFTDGENVIRQEFTTGINAAQLTREEIRKKIGEIDIRGVQRIRFYGAGCVGGEVNLVVEQELAAASGCSDVCVNSDIVGAAVGTLGTRKGIICILGTGANSALWDGEKIVSKINAGGYILGDEGSGAVMGRQLISDYVKGLTPAWMTDILEEKYGLSYAIVVDKVYRQPMPNRWLAGFAKLLAEHRQDWYVRDLVSSAFRMFIERNVCRYEGWENLECAVVGSIGYYFSIEFREVCSELGVNLQVIKKDPF